MPDKAGRWVPGIDCVCIKPNAFVHQIIHRASGVQKIPRFGRHYHGHIARKRPDLDDETDSTGKQVDILFVE
jgi:hypothetical protein